MRIIVEGRICKTKSSSWKNTRTIKIQSIYRQSRMTLYLSLSLVLHLFHLFQWKHTKVHCIIIIFKMCKYICMACIHAIEICKFTQANCCWLFFFLYMLWVFSLHFRLSSTEFHHLDTSSNYLHCRHVLLFVYKLICERIRHTHTNTRWFDNKSARKIFIWKWLHEKKST